MKRAFQNLLIIVLSFVSASAISIYLQWQPEPLVRTLCFIGLVFALRHLRIHVRSSASRMECVALALFSLFFSISIVLGYHIVISDGYSGLITQNYITEYSVLDIIALAFIWGGLFSLLCWSYLLIENRSNTSRESKMVTLEPLGKQWIAGLSLVIFLLFIPYLLAYFPGLVFSDTLTSIYQANGSIPWSNHHPVAYTLFIKCCIAISNLFGWGPTGGCAIYSVIQMAIMAICFGYLSRWIVVRANLKFIWGFVIAIGLACTPSIAIYSVAMWKDPLFSVTIVMLSVLLFDLLVSQFSIVKRSHLWIVLFSFCLLSMILLRNNGFYIACLILAVLIIVLLFNKKRKLTTPKSPIMACVLVILASLIIVGPIYKSANVQSTPRAESVGLFLNQMARAAALDINMGASDREYMNTILPYEEYPTTYRPTCVDLLKWDDKFNSSAIDKTFFNHWISIGLKNPITYFEAWELQTCGFWTVNQESSLANTSNITGGVPRNIFTNRDTGGILFANIFNDDEVREILPLHQWSLPAGLINWLIGYLLLCFVLLKRKRWILSLVPSIGLILTLIVASPIHYWPRYEAAVYFLIPFYIALLVMLCKGLDAPAKDKNSASPSSI